MCDACAALDGEEAAVPQEEIDAAVEKGASLLDEHKEDWFAPANLDTGRLQLSSITNCVLGQNYGEFYNGLRQLGLEYAEAPTYGFSFGAEADEDSWIRLTAAWKAQIERRRETLVAA